MRSANGVVAAPPAVAISNTCGQAGDIRHAISTGRYRAGGTQMPRSCMSLTCRLMTLSRYSRCFMGARLR